jgi:hypothetical protein
MTTIVTSTWGSIASFAIIFTLGFIMSHFGRPYGGLLFNAHKLAALAFGVFLIVRVYRINQAAGLSAPELALVILTALLFLSLAVFGGLLSTDKPVPAVINQLHHILPYLAAASTIGLGFLLHNR